MTPGILEPLIGRILTLEELATEVGPPGGIIGPELSRLVDSGHVEVVRRDSPRMFTATNRGIAAMDVIWKARAEQREMRRNRFS